MFRETQNRVEGLPNWKIGKAGLLHEKRISRPHPLQTGASGRSYQSFRRFIRKSKCASQDSSTNYPCICNVK